MPRYVRRGEEKTWGEDLYLFRAQGTGMIKIGRSCDVERRRRDVQRGCPWVDVELMAVFGGLGYLEALIHQILESEYTRARRAGNRSEWWDLSEDEVYGAVRASINILDANGILHL
jgi:hypothetical protein